MRSRRIFLATIVASSLFGTACLRDVGKTIGELQALRNALTNRFGDEVYVNLNGASQHLALTLTFINSALNNKSLEERATRAQAAANIVKTSYARAKNLEAIWVVFVRQKTTMVVFHQTQTIDYFGFDKDAKRVTPPATGSSSSGVELKTAAVYIDTSHETDVSVSGIQLSGIPGEKGLTILPHFRVAGDVKKGRARPPRQVSFDFASYSDKSEFRQTTPIAFLADGKQILRSDGTFTGTNTQFCYLTVPYRAFRQMIDAKQLTIKVGDKDYPLTRGQFAALQQMGVYVND
ncbi:MAG TPA: hypothetical protein VIK76_12780 [Pyrinomonadaceae bacterium]